MARQALLRLSRSRWLAEQMSRRAFARRAVRRFMPGEAPEAALEASRQLAGKGLGTLLTQLGENLTSLDEAAAVRDHYLWLCDQIRVMDLHAQPSVKLTQFGLDLSVEACTEHMLALAAKAEANGLFLWVDIEDSSYVDRTLAIFRRLRERHEKVGLCLQAYLHRTPADLQSLMPLSPAIRLVKGAYAETPAVAMPLKADVDRAYGAIGERLLDAAAQGQAYPVFGTHDLGLVGRLCAYAGQQGVPDGSWEIAMLYGIRSAEQERLAGEGRRIRTLISYGKHWFPWYMRRLAERPANVWFVAKSMLGG
jgi:proline dehydrogenase